MRPSLMLVPSHIAAALRAAGVAPGDTVIAHASLKRLGWVLGAEMGLLGALLDVLGPEGTVLVPTFTQDLTDPSGWTAPPVPAGWWDTIRREMPPFRPEVTPSRGMGRVAELVRTWPGARRTAHPTLSFAAIGSRAADLLASQPLEEPFGEASPLGALYRLDGKVLLFGVRHANDTSLHLAEARAGWPAAKFDASDFDALGQAYEAERGLGPSPLGRGSLTALRMRPIVDFGADWIARNRLR